jgi:UrcA family protein
MDQIVKYVLGALAALLVVASQGAALGASLEVVPGQSVSVAVKYADLDLNRPADVQVLYHRITRAADRACGEREFTGSHLPGPSWEQCVAGAVEQAVERLDRPALSAYHREHSTDVARKG